MVFDNPTPSANGTMLLVLTRLALLTGEREYMSRASTLGAAFPAEVTRMLNGSGSFPRRLRISGQQPGDRGDRPQGQCQDP